MSRQFREFLRRTPLAPLWRGFRGLREARRRAAQDRNRALLIDRVRAAVAGVSEPFFVTVGANDGVMLDPLAEMVRSEGRWRGLLVEPVPHLFARLQANYPDAARFTLAQVAVADRSGELPFYYVNERARQELPGMPDWFDGLGSFDRSHIARWEGGVLEPYIVEASVPCLPLPALLARHGVRRVDLLLIDTEGYDYQVLRQVDLVATPPAAVLVEYKHLTGPDHKALRTLLRRHGYRVYDCHQDYLAVRA